MSRPNKQTIAWMCFKNKIASGRDAAEFYAERFKEIGDSLNQEKLTIVRDILDDLVKNLEAVKIDSK